MKRKAVLKTVLFMVAATLLSKIFGMLRDVLLASGYGTSYEAVAYETASRLPILLFDFVLGGVVVASFIPIFNEILVKKDKKEAMDFANRYVNLVLVITLGITVLGVFFSDALVGLLAPDLVPDTHALAVSLSRVMFPMVVFTGLAFSFVGILQSLGEFNLPSLISLVSNGMIVLYFIFFDKYFGIWGLSVTMLLGWAAQALVQLPALSKKGYRYAPTLDFRSPYIKRALSLAFPILVSTWAQPAFTIIATRFASSIAEGRAIIAVGYANRLNLIIVGVFSFVATNLIFPMIARAESRGNEESTERMTSISSKLLMLVLIPICVGAVILAEPIISLIYERGEFGEKDVALTAGALRYFALAMPVCALNEVLTKLFFAKQKVKVPMISALLSIGFSLVLTPILCAPFGVAGIALASTLASTFGTIVNYVCLRASKVRVFVKGDLYAILGMIISALVMGEVVYLVYSNTAQMGTLISLVLSVGAGVLSYGLAMAILNFKKVYDIFRGNK